MHRRISGTYLCFHIFFTLAVGGHLYAQEQTESMSLPNAIEQAEKAAVDWLQDRILPNEEIPNPTPLRRRMVQSYILDQSNPDYPLIYHRSYTYDNAVAAIALTMMGNYQDAELIISALQRNMLPDGSMWFAYNTINDWPYAENSEGALIRSGALAWAGYAAAFYLRERIRENPWFMEDDLLAGDVLKMATEIGTYLLDQQVDDPDDGRYGLVTGGWGNYQLFVEQREIEERSYLEKITWVSMEHNVDIYFLFRDLGTLTGDKQWGNAAILVRQGLMRLWSQTHGQFFRGYRIETGIDTALPLDGASWGSLFLHAVGNKRKSSRCLEEMEDRFYHQGENSSGYRPYSDEPVYENAQVNAYHYPEAPDTRWKDIDIVWGEGSLGAAAAYARADMDNKALRILHEMQALERDGGFLYASAEIPYQFSTDPSVASTAWYIITCEILKETDTSDLFWGRY